MALPTRHVNQGLEGLDEKVKSYLHEAWDIDKLIIFGGWMIWKLYFFYLFLGDRPNN